jgi:hypothetical protein
MAVRLSALLAGRPLPPGRLLVLISVTDWVEPRAITRLEELGKLEKKSGDLIGNRTRNRTDYRILPQPTTLPCTPLFISGYWYLQFKASLQIKTEVLHLEKQMFLFFHSQHQISHHLVIGEECTSHDGIHVNTANRMLQYMIRSLCSSKKYC